MRKTDSPPANSSFFGFSQLLLSGRFLRVLAIVYGLSALLLWATLLVMFFGGAGKAPGRSIGPDFAAYYTAGTMVKNGKKAQLYNFARQGEIQRKLQITQGKNEFSAFVHPAQNAWLMAPLSTRSPRVAYAIYAVLMLLCFVASLWLLRTITPNLQVKSGGFLLLLALVSSPVYFSISAGQNTGITLLLHSAILVSLLQRRDVLAGALCAVGLLKPHLFLALLPLFIFGKRPHALLSFAFFAVLTVAFDLWFFGHDVFVRNIAALGTPIYQREEILQGARMFSWQSFWKLLIGNNFAATILGWSCALAVFVALCVLWKNFADAQNANAQIEYSKVARSPRASAPNSAREVSIDAPETRDFSLNYADENAPEFNAANAISPGAISTKSNATQGNSQNRFSQEEFSSQTNVPETISDSSKSVDNLPNETAKSARDFALLYAITICGIVVFAPHLPVYDLGLLLLPALIFADRVLDFPTTRFVALRLTLLALIVLTALGEEFARQTHFQIVVPFVTLLAFLAVKMCRFDNASSIS